MHMELPWMECYLRITHFLLCSPFLGLVCMLHLCAHMKECGREKSVSSSVCLYQCPPYLSRFSMILNLFFAGRMTLQWAAGAYLSPLLGAGVAGTGLHAWLFRWCWECDCKVWNMYSKHFINWNHLPYTGTHKNMEEYNFSYVFAHSNRQNKELNPVLLWKSHPRCIMEFNGLYTCHTVNVKKKKKIL